MGAQAVLVELLADEPAPGGHRVSIVAHAHLDTAWFWPLRETVRKCARTFSTVLELMDRYPDYRFVVSQAQHLAWMRDGYPDLWERMKVRIAEGRLEPTGSMWVESDCNLPSGSPSSGRSLTASNSTGASWGSRPRTCGCPTSSGTPPPFPRS